MSDGTCPARALRVQGWETIPKLVHGFYGRRDGVSRGAYAELNMSFRVGDHAEAVRRNWERVSADTPAGVRFMTMVQVHGATVADIDSLAADPPEADALVTHASGVALSVLTADCVPILLVAPKRHAIAAVHAGWRGTVGGVVADAVRCLRTSYDVEPKAIHAALGPAIGGCCYEVGPEVVQALHERWGLIPGALQARGSCNPRLDLRRANEEILLRAGLRATQIAHVGPCTRCAVADYFSHRATGSTGRQLSFIAWKN